MKSILAYLKDHPAVDNVLNFLINAVLVIAVAFVILRVSRKLFQKIQNRKTKFNTQFTEKIFRFLVIFISIMWLVMSNSLPRSFGQSLFQSTAVIAAIAGFAAQNVLADLICGIILSSTKPFEPGDRIELENGITGIVKEVTLRHVVLQGIDTLFCDVVGLPAAVSCSSEEGSACLDQLDHELLTCSGSTTHDSE